MTRPAVGVALVGIGGWGHHIARTLIGLPQVELRWICDQDSATLSRATGLCPHAQPTAALAEVLADPTVEAVVLATPAATHYALGLQILEAGRDLFVEKPMALETRHAEALQRCAQAGQRILMVGHLLYYHPALIQLRALVRAGTLGTLRTLVSQRLNLGTVRSDENALWSLAPHDVSVALHLMGRMPSQVSARGLACLGRPVEDVAFLTLDFEGQALAQIQVSWLDPRKTRCLTVVGTEAMAVFDDLEPVEKLRLHDKRVRLPAPTEANTPPQLHQGGVFAPELPGVEPLRAELEHFADCVRTRRLPLSDGHDGIRVLQVLSAAQASLAAGGRMVTLDAVGASPPLHGDVSCL